MVVITKSSVYHNMHAIYFFSGTVEDTELVEGLVLDQKASHLAGGVTRVEKAKIGLIQFCISPPKTDVRDSAHNMPVFLKYHLVTGISVLY